jgi:hypothetical protein
MFLPLPPILSDNEARAAFVRKVGPCPLQHNEQSILEAVQIIDVNNKPDHPGDPAMQLQVAYFQDSFAAADRRQLAFIDKSEGAPGQASGFCQDGSGNVPSLLHGHGSGARKRLPGLMNVDGLIACDEHVGVAWDTHVCFY